MSYMKREEAYNLLSQYVTKPNLIRHSLAVEATMRHFAKQHNEDVDYWGNVGLLHDVDYELYPEQHCHKTADLIGGKVDDKFIRAIQSHGYWLFQPEITPTLYMEKILVTIDQLTGFITACALILPSKSLADVQMKSMLKRWKTPSFAGGTQRDRIEYCCGQLGVTVESMLAETLTAMQGIHESLCL